VRSKYKQIKSQNDYRQIIYMTSCLIQMAL